MLFKSVWFVYVLSCAIPLSSCQLSVTVDELPVEVERSYAVNNTQEFIVEISNITSNVEKTPPRVQVKCVDCNEANPVLVVVRQNKGVLSWELPIVVESESHNIPFTETARTLCPYDIINASCSEIYNKDANQTCPMQKSRSRILEDRHHSVTVSLSTSSEKNVTVVLKVYLETDFIIPLLTNKTVQLTPSTPRFYLYEFPSNENVTSVILRVDSNDDTCMVVSVQNVSCPVFDLERNIEYDGRWQTVTRRGGLTITREMFPKGFYAVFVVSGEDDGCTEGSIMPAKISRNKKITLWVEQTITKEFYFVAIGLTVIAICIFYILMIAISFLYFMRIKTTDFNFEADGAYESHEPSTSTYDQRLLLDANSTLQSPITPETENTLSIRTDSSLDETDFDTLPDAEVDKNIFRTKSMLYVCDLARKNSSVLKKKSQLYLWNLLTVAIFYFLPVVQLVITYQQQLNETGNLDLCYYNFLCSHPFWLLSDFNHVFSNIGYLFLGLLFVFLTHRRETIHKKAISSNKILDRCYGIPQHFGLFYAMGAALVIEGILSACYHVCPNNYNFQFDSSFMYVISTLCMLKIYQTRHPDINASAYATFSLLAVVIFLGMCGILKDTVYFWSIFSVIHLSACLYLSLKIYYMGRWSLDLCNLRRFWTELKSCCRNRQCRSLLPMYPSRFTLIAFANVCNWVLAVVGPLYQPLNFATYLLTIFMANLMLYTLFYIAMKVIYKEKIMVQPWIYILLSVLCWSSSLYFFFNRSVSWKLTPALSKLYNQPCKLLDFYDNHDIWHFVSSAAMFFSFMVLLTLDDDLVYVHRAKILVF